MDTTDEGPWPALDATAAWRLVGLLARKRRERLELKQEDLRLYGGPGVTTVGKIERAAQANFPMRTQQQLEKALGWRRGAVAHIFDTAWEGRADFLFEDLLATYVEDDLPDLTAVRPSRDDADFVAAPGDRQEGTVSNAELLAEIRALRREVDELKRRPGGRPE